MRERRRRRVDPVEREIETALQPGRFIPDRISFTFASERDGVAATIAKLIPIDAGVRGSESFIVHDFVVASHLASPYIVGC